MGNWAFSGNNNRYTQKQRLRIAKGPFTQYYEYVLRLVKHGYALRIMQRISGLAAVEKSLSGQLSKIRSIKYVNDKLGRGLVRPIFKNSASCIICYG